MKKQIAVNESFELIARIEKTDSEKVDSLLESFNVPFLREELPNDGTQYCKTALDYKINAINIEHACFIKNLIHHPKIWSQR